MNDANERRLFKRIETRRDVIIVPENSDEFNKAVLIDHSSNGVCFLSAHPFQIDTRIYIITDNKPIDDFNEKYIEAYFANIIWCKEKEAQYCIGAEVVKAELKDPDISDKIRIIFNK